MYKGSMDIWYLSSIPKKTRAVLPNLFRKGFGFSGESTSSEEPELELFLEKLEHYQIGPKFSSF